MNPLALQRKHWLVADRYRTRHTSSEVDPPFKPYTIDLALQMRFYQICDVIVSISAVTCRPYLVYKGLPTAPK